MMKLGQMYADGDGVPRDDVRAFEHFKSIYDRYADEADDSPNAPAVAKAYVALGSYLVAGIPNSYVRANPARARELFDYAATYFGDPNAQYNLAMLQFDGVGGPKDPRKAVRWLNLAAQKGHVQAQAVLGNVLFFGESAKGQKARGLMWLMLAATARTSSATGGSSNFSPRRPPRRARRSAPARSKCSRSRSVVALERYQSLSSAMTGTCVGRFLPAADMLVDAAGDKLVGRFRRQQQVVDADAVVLLPGAGLIVPEGVLPLPHVAGAEGVGQPRRHELGELRPRPRQVQCIARPCRGSCTSLGVGMTL